MREVQQTVSLPFDLRTLARCLATSTGRRKWHHVQWIPDLLCANGLKSQFCLICENFTLNVCAHLLAVMMCNYFWPVQVGFLKHGVSLHYGFCQTNGRFEQHLLILHASEMAYMYMYLKRAYMYILPSARESKEHTEGLFWLCDWVCNWLLSNPRGDLSSSNVWTLIYMLVEGASFYIYTCMFLPCCRYGVRPPSTRKWGTSPSRHGWCCGQWRYLLTWIYTVYTAYMYMYSSALGKPFECVCK